MFFVGLCRIVQILRHTQDAEWVKETVLALIGVSRKEETENDYNSEVGRAVKEVR